MTTLSDEALRRCRLHAENFLWLHGSPRLRLPLADLYWHARAYADECPFEPFRNVARGLRAFEHATAGGAPMQTADECERTRADMRLMLGPLQSFFSFVQDTLRQPCA